METDYKKIVELTKAVRAAQIAYFKDRTKENLVKSKQLEKELDELLKPPVKDYKKIILDRIDDLLTDFVYYDRKEDSELSIEELNNAFRKNLVTVDEVVEKVRKCFESFKEEIKSTN